jgi:hypothetical protein
VAGTCWLVVDGQGQSPLIAGQFARLRGMDVRLTQTVDGIFADLSQAPRTLLVATGIGALEAASKPRRQWLRALIANGATLYVRGGFRPKTAHKLLFAEHGFCPTANQRLTAARFSSHPLLPSALEDEPVECELQTLGAHCPSGAAEELLSGCSGSGQRQAVIFAKQAGEGVVIYDLQPCNDVEDERRSLLARLTDPAARCSCVGALAAVDRACNRNPKKPVSFNLTIDDRPANYDYLSVFSLRRLLEHVERRCPGAHIDFAWVPNQSHASAPYVAVLKRFNTGFLWHGLCRHVDHRRLTDAASELTLGKRMVNEISRRYEVKFQPVMIFPYERSSFVCLRLIEREGFVACAESHRSMAELDRALPAYLRCSRAGRLSSAGAFITLFRYPAAAFTRDMMLARAALGLPIMVAAHPADVGLRRFSSLRKGSGTISHFDPVLEFVAAKGLRACSVEQIACELIAESTFASHLVRASA